MSGSTLNVCFVGAGFIAEYHARALQRVKGARLAAVCDVSAGRAQEFARKWSVPAAYTDLQRMLAEQKPHVVHVLTPPDRHCAAALAAIDAGAHVLVGKLVCIAIEKWWHPTKKAGIADRALAFGITVLRAAAARISLLGIAHAARDFGVFGSTARLRPAPGQRPRDPGCREHSLDPG